MSFGHPKSESSMKLKSQNLKNARRQTDQMAEETRRMEVRLQELKLAMAHEREERERQGSGFWRSAQTNDPNATKDKNAKGRKMKVSVLKDEPIVLPERSKQPGTFGGIARNKISPREKKIKGPKCGQCEAKAAHVSCLECAEDYCASCFASFHLKGALKKHRSVPVGNQGGARASLTPRRANNGDVVLHMSPREDTTERPGPVGSSRHFEGGSLLHGTYDDEAGKADFQLALEAWRKEKNSPPKQEKKVSFAPSKSQTEFGTDTGSDNVLTERKVEINFNTSGMTYAEKLLLKQHRRNDMQIGVPANVRPLVESPRNTHSSYSENEDRVNFDSLKQVAIPEGDRDKLASASKVRITEIDTTKVRSASLRGIPQTSMFHVEEREDREPPPRSPTPVASPSPPPTPNAPKGPRRAFATPSPTGRRRMAAVFSPEPPPSRELPTKTPIMGFNDPTPVSSPRHQPKVKQPRAKVRDVKPEETPEQNDIDVDELVKRVQEEKERKTPRPKSAAKSRPQSARSQSRAQSRAESARPKSRTWMYGEGVLTKVPSEELSAISKLAHDTVGNILKKVGMESIAPSSTTLTDFFRMGVASPPPQERIMTPSGDRGKTDDKYKISNKVYQMGPRSWRPDSSLGNNVDDDAVVGHLGDAGVRDGVRDFYDAGNVPAPTEETDAKSRETDEATVSFSLQKKQQQPQHSVKEPERTRSSHSRAESSTSVTRSSEKRASRVKTPGRSHSAAVGDSIFDDGVMDGEDLSRYDEVGKRQSDDRDDSETLDQLEWELASQEGRLTAEGKVSRMSVVDTDLSDEERELGIQKDDGRGTGLTTPDPDQAFVQEQLRASVLMDDFEEMEAMVQDASDVKALH